MNKKNTKMIDIGPVDNNRWIYSMHGLEKPMDQVLASGVMAGSIATLAALWIGFQTMGFFGYSHVIGGYKLPIYFHNHAAVLNGIENNIIMHSAAAGIPKLPRITEEALNNSVKFAITHVNRMNRLEENLVHAGIGLTANTPSHSQYIFASPSEDALEMQSDAIVAAKASAYLVQHHCQRYGLSDETCARYISKLKLDGTSLGASCASAQLANCEENSPYRSIDGSCNNAENSRWGSALTAYSRVLFPHYSDGIQEPRRAERRRKQLPGARLVSTSFSRSNDQSDVSKTLAVMQWSEFIAHDIAHTPVRQMVTNRKPINCCSQDGSWLSPRYIHPDCAAIRVPERDPVYGSHYVSCMNYVRSLPVIGKDCNFGPIEQMNQVSHFLDGSTIYGSTPNRSTELRTFAGGKLLVEIRDNRDYLPASGIDPHSRCRTAGACYKAGDDRVNFEPSLAVFHTVWHREHNRVAKKLAEINPLWSDEIIYQEARRIVIAEIQHITYKEWLPTVFGKDYTNAIGLGINSAHSRDYNPYEDPAVSNEAATAVLRFLNSLKQGQLSLPDDARQRNASIQLSEHFYKPRVIESDDIFDGLLRGLATQTSNKMDAYFVPDITHRLYKTNTELGLDAISLDIQQGRDHGLPGYNYYRKYCGLPGARKFDDFLDHIPQETLNKLKTLYDHPNDVDLVIGGIAEQPVDDSLLGPTFRCLLSEQLARTRWTDRYFYDSATQPRPFTSEQLKQLRKVTLARIFCDNGNNISRMQPNVFIKPQAGNEVRPCDDFEAIPSIDLYAFAEKAKAYR